MKYLSALLFTCITLSALADPAVKNVQVNIHNNTKHQIELKKFSSSRLFASTRFTEENIEGFSSADNAVFFTSFDKDAINAGVDVLINDEPMTLMWQINMGYDGPDAPKFHICGVIKDNNARIDQEHCNIPYVDHGTLIIDFNIE